MRPKVWACLLALAIAGCGSPPPAAHVARWIVGQPAPAFDPQGPPDPVRWSLERMLSRGLVDEDSAGRTVMAAAETVKVSPDGLTYTFTLRQGLKFSDGGRCTSAEFRDALRAGIGRADHATDAWLLGALEGMERVRAGRPLPHLGIETPDLATVVLRLGRPDPDLLRKLAVPGVGVPWSGEGPGGWGYGIGDYQIASAGPQHLMLVRRVRWMDLADTVHVDFVPLASRVRGWLRVQTADLVWPLPPDLLDQPLPPDYRARTAPAAPERRLLLIERADLPPMNRPAARFAFSYGINREDAIAALGPRGLPSSGWLPGGGAFDFPRHDPDEVRAWLARGKLGRSVHAALLYSRDGAGARVAAPLQAEWARLGLDVELHAMGPPQIAGERLRSGGAQLMLVEGQPPIAGPAAELATLVQPMRGPAVGSFRTGWATREFDRWLAGAPMAPADVVAAQQRLADERVALPLARLPWAWVEREGANGACHPHFGPLAARCAR